METKTAKKEFKGYPIRRIRMSKEEWLLFRERKLKHGKNWNSFIKMINKKLK